MSADRKELIERYPALARLPSDSSWTALPRTSLAERRKLLALIRTGEVDRDDTSLPDGKPVTLYRWSKTSKHRSQIDWLQDDLRAFAESLLARASSASRDSDRRSEIAMQASAHRKARQ